MRMLGRRASVGVTTLALLLAGVGTSLAAVRAARYEGVTSPGVALPVPGARAPAPADPLDSTVERPFGFEDQAPPLPDGSDPAAEPGAAGPAPAPAPPGSGSPAVPGPTTPDGSSPSPEDPGGGIETRPPPAGSAPPVAGSTTVPTLGPAAGPTPTTGLPSRPSSIACPSNDSAGALSPRTGGLQAVDFVLPWPGATPLVLVPHRGAAREAGSSVKIVDATGGHRADDGSSLTLDSQRDVRYTLEAGQVKATGSIRFERLDDTVPNQSFRACRGRSFTLYDVARQSITDSALRIVGVAAPSDTVTVDDAGGAARFQSSAVGTHRVTLITASDAGVAGPLVIATVTVA